MPATCQERAKGVTGTSPGWDTLALVVAVTRIPKDRQGAGVGWGRGREHQQSRPSCPPLPHMGVYTAAGAQCTGEFLLGLDLLALPLHTWSPHSGPSVHTPCPCPIPVLSSVVTPSGTPSPGGSRSRWDTGSHRPQGLGLALESRMTLKPLQKGEGSGGAALCRPQEICSWGAHQPSPQCTQHTKQRFSRTEISICKVLGTTL